MKQPSIDWQAALSAARPLAADGRARALREPQAVDEVMQEVALAAVQSGGAAGRSGEGRAVAVSAGSACSRSSIGASAAGGGDWWDRMPTGAHRPMTGPAASRRSAGLAAGRGAAGAGAAGASQLPRRDAEILLLKYTENWSYHQIAAHLGIGHSAVEARLHRARGADAAGAGGAGCGGGGSR